jgi:ribosomal protein S18 acetylase RimI-like enzyme
MLRIHPATHADLEALRDVGCTTYREHFAHIWSPAGLQAFLDRDFSPASLNQSLESSDSQTWLLASDESERPVGLAKINWSAPAPVTGEVGAELRKIYFLKSAAGRGYGKRLVQYICEQAVERGDSLLWLTVLTSNPDARRFYQAFGFQVMGQIPFKTDLAEIGMDVMGFDLKRLGQ